MELWLTLAECTDPAGAWLFVTIAADQIDWADDLGGRWLVWEGGRDGWTTGNGSNFSSHVKLLGNISDAHGTLMYMMHILNLMI
jgi:hypothetical protein